MKLVETEEGKQHFAHIHDMQNSEGFRIFTQYYMKEIIEEMAKDLLSMEFASQPGNIKDAKQRAYAMTYEVIGFFIDPMKEVRKLQKLKEKTSRPKGGR